MKQDVGKQSATVPVPSVADWGVAVLLALCYAVAYLDRQVISLLIKPIEGTLHITDTQFGLLQGVSFSLFYVAATYPLAWLADHTRRSRVISGSIAFWSAATMACGFVGSFAQLMTARIGVAMGEAGLTPAALATLSDRFHRQRLATPTSLFMLAPYLGGGMALGLGGATYAWAKALAPTALLPRLGFADWQIVFLIVGALGLIPTVLLLFIADRKNSTPASMPTNRWEIFALFGSEWRVFVLYSTAMAVMMIVLSSYVTWLPAAIMRSKAIDEAGVGRVFGPIYLTAGVIGTLSAGAVIARFARADPVRTVIRYMLTMLVVLWPLSIYGPMTASLTIELATMGASLFLISSVMSLSSLALQYTTPKRLRAQAMALQAMIAALVGTGAGPVLAGVLSDHLHAFHYPLSVALALIGAVCVPVAMLLLWIALRRHAEIRLDLVHAEPDEMVFTGH